MSFKILIAIVFISLNSMAHEWTNGITPMDFLGRRSWEKINVPNLKCASGVDYHFFYSKGKKDKLAFDFMGGGACWSFATCFAHKLKTITIPVPTVLESGGFVSKDPLKSPVSDYSMVYFPYCTGDVYLGDYDTNYGGIKVHHRGKSNIEYIIKNLQKLTGINKEDINHLVVYGYSAGAIGALGHVDNINQQFKNAYNKVLISDAPGLHFGKKFFAKFPKEYVDSFIQIMKKYGLKLDINDGNVSQILPKLCEQLPDWRVGILQGSKDIVMSAVFGEISAQEQEKQIFSPNGLYHLTERPEDNCSAWIPQTYMHTFLITDTIAGINYLDISAKDFIFQLLEPQSILYNYR